MRGVRVLYRRPVGADRTSSHRWITHTRTWRLDRRRPGLTGGDPSLSTLVRYSSVLLLYNSLIILLITKIIPSVVVSFHSPQLFFHGGCIVIIYNYTKRRCIGVKLIVVTTLCVERSVGGLIHWSLCLFVCLFMVNYLKSRRKRLGDLSNH